MLSIIDERRHKKIQKLIADARKRVAKMTPAQVRRMLKRQEKSWAKQDKD